MLAVVFQVRCPGSGSAREKPQLNVLLWQRAREPQVGHGPCPVTAAKRRGFDHLGSASTGRESRPARARPFGAAGRVLRSPPGAWRSGDRIDVFGSGALPRHPGTATRHPLASGDRATADGVRPRSDGGPRPARLVAKMSYTNIGFALAPKEFALSTLRDIYSATLGYQVDATNLQRVLAAAASSPRPAPSPSRPQRGPPAALYRFTDSRLRVTDEFAALRPPS
ncbi:nUDIX family hydrolase [Mycobacterium xenopi 4042]|uniref:NUDIX family hydrolase n=1 Tax=Mycobacterium xenopi 4042 TaxID=1299334 RepID=X7YNM9_MYCXE|nr:nUDIX family hydrolase [Mycobacterium xenopi 4042]